MHAVVLPKHLCLTPACFQALSCKKLRTLDLSGFEDLELQHLCQGLCHVKVGPCGAGVLQHINVFHGCALPFVLDGGGLKRLQRVQELKLLKCELQQFPAWLPLI